MVPHVTGILSGLTDYSRIPPETLKKAQDEGIAIHKMVELDCKGDLESVPEWLGGRFKAWQRFKEETGFACWFSEKRGFHPRQRYAGTLDLAGELTKLPKVKWPALVDVKRSLYAGPAIGLQTAGYVEAIKHETGMPQNWLRFALVLNDSGTYRLTEFADPTDPSVFLAQLVTFHWRQKHGKHE